MLNSMLLLKQFHPCDSGIPGLGAKFSPVLSSVKDLLIWILTQDSDYICVDQLQTSCAAVASHLNDTFGFSCILCFIEALWRWIPLLICELNWFCNVRGKLSEKMSCQKSDYIKLYKSNCILSDYIFLKKFTKRNS